MSDRIVNCAALLAAGLIVVPMSLAAESDGFQGQAVRPQTFSLNLPSQPLAESLRAVAKISQTSAVFDDAALTGIAAPKLQSNLTFDEAMTELLKGTGLTYQYVDNKTIVLVAVKPTAAAAGSAGRIRADEAGSPLRLAQATPQPPDAVVHDSAESSSSSEPESIDMKGIPEILVKGSKSLNMDITRTRDDPQPYVVLDRELIERSGATSLDQLLQQRLSVNTSVADMGTSVSVSTERSGSSSINLRGLGTNQTLILVDGHRMSAPTVGGGGQGNIGGISLALIERIEILPSTASGIYGGSATGGVINIITRKDFSGGEARVTYDDTFSGSSAIRKMDFLFGHKFNEGKTNVLLSGSYSDANTLTEAERGFVSRGRDHIQANNPAYFTTFPPVGSRPNFVSADGSDLVLKSGETLGSSFGSVPAGYGGVTTDGGAALAANVGQYDWTLPEGGAGLGRELYAEPTIKAGGLVLRHEFNHGLQAFVDMSTSESVRTQYEARAIWLELSAESPYNPFANDIRGLVAPPTYNPNESVTKRHRVVTGVIKELPANWSMNLDYTWDRTGVELKMFRSVELENLMNSGAVDVLRDLNADPLGGEPTLYMTSDIHTTMKDVNLRFSGPLGSAPGGRAILSAAFGHREEVTPDSWYSYRNLLEIFYPDRSTSVNSAYLEYRVPLFSAVNGRPGLKELELQLAARHENYISRSAGEMLFFGDELPSPLPESVRGRNEFSSTDPTIALRWKPVDDLALRVSYGTGFLPPGLDQIVRMFNPSPVNGAEDGLVDPRRGNTTFGDFTYFSGRADLKPERSKSWSAGLVFTPVRAPNFRLSVDYTRIEKSDNIGLFPGTDQEIINAESLFPELVVRGPNLPGDPADWPGPIIQLSSGPLNLSKLKLEAWDTQINYHLDASSLGSFDLFLLGTWQPRYEIQVLTSQPTIDYVGVGSDHPLEFKANVGATWQRAAWRAGWNLNYFDSYRVVADWNVEVASQGDGGRVPSQSYNDVFVSYDFDLGNAGDNRGWLSGTQVQLGVRNIFNKRPPVDVSRMDGYAYYSPFGSPRLASYYLTLTKRF